MQISQSPFEKYVFVCEHERAEGDFCGVPGTQIREALKAKVKAEKLDRRVRVSRAGCLDACAEGPNVLIMPDNIWLKKVSAEDIGSILEVLKKNLSA